MPLLSKHKKFPNLLRQLNIISFCFIIFFSIFLGVNQAWKLQTPDVIKNQWIALLITATLFLIILILSLKKKASHGYYYSLVFSQIVTYTAFISYIIYAQRGMASSAIILYVIPILIAALTRASWVVITTSVLAGASYSLSAYKYFADFPSEGYKAELYGQMLFYFLILILIGRLVHIALVENNKY
ncbi:hypothetical protein KC950_01560 [Candidatus Saccharibacteria bacterium]|nr:hypothetical protein [Candidatus Saccharibacteria bacterium]